MTLDSRNFLYVMLKAVDNDQSTLQWQEISDDVTTSQDAALEEQFYSAWSAVLQKDANSIQTYYNNNKGNWTAAAQGQMQVLQNQYQEDSSQAQTQENACDGATQASQTTAGQDGNNLQNKAQLASTLASISSTMASLLAHAYA